MKLERTFAGLAASARVRGAGRFGGALFLGVWLCFWIVGECFALFLVGWGAWSLATGQPPKPGAEPITVGVAAGVGLFLLAWLAFWTFGGWAAGRELLRLLFGRDELLARPDQLEVAHRWGLGAEKRVVPRASLRRFHVPTARGPLVVETDRGSHEIFRYAEPADAARLAAALNAEYQLRDEPSPAGALPEPWIERAAPEGGRLILRDPAARRKQAIFLWFVCLPLAALAAFLVQAAVRDLSLGALAAIVSALAIFAGWGAHRLASRQPEWRLESGALVHQLRTRGGATPVFHAASVQLEEDRDSDGDPWFRLVALNATAPTGLLPRADRSQRKEIDHRARDRSDLAAFGRWLGDACAIPFIDATTPRAKDEEHERLREQLAASGRFGRWVAARLPRRPR